MKQKLLSSIRLRLALIVALLCSLGTGTAWADETYTLTASTDVTSNVSSYSTSVETLTGADGSKWVVTGYGSAANTSVTIGKGGANYLKTPEVPEGYKIKSVAVTWSGNTSYYLALQTTSGTELEAKSNPSTATEGTFTISSGTYRQLQLVGRRSSGTSNAAATITKVVVTYGLAAPAYSITAVSNDDNLGTVALDGTTITATPKSGNRVSTSTPYSISPAESATVAQSGNVFTVTPSANTTVTINFEEIPSYEVTINSVSGGTLTVMNGETPVADGDEILDGTVLTITATPDDEHNFRNWQAIDASTHTYTKSNSGTYTIEGRGVTFNANFDAKVYHNAIFQKYDGSEYVTHATKKTEVGQPIDFAGVSDPADMEGRTFIGWVEAKIDDPVDSPAPSFITSANMGDANVTYYACYAYCTPGSSATKTDKLTTATFGSPDSYGNWSSKSATNSGHSDAVYAGNTTTYSGTVIQMRDNTNSGIVSTTSGGKAKKVTVTWNSYTTDGRTLNVYGKNTAYTASSDLYDDEKKGTLLGTIVYGTSTELSITGDYEYIGLVSNKGAMYLDEIDIDWQTGTPDTYSGYCTTVPEDARTAVNIETFTATNTTLVIGDNSTTNVTNDQDGWTESYIYTSDNTSVATVSDEGVITAVAKGTANITVTLDIPISGGSYKKGTTSSKSIEITVTKPFHTVTFMANGSEVSSASVEEDADIDVPSPVAVGNFSFQGWKEGSAIDGTQASAPSYASITTMGDADVTYYAVYAVEKDVTATFDASDITATPATGNSREWEHTATGILLYLTAGQHYTGGIPYTFTVTKGTGNYFRITTPTGGEIKQIVTTISETDYKIGSVTAGSLSTSGTTQTVTFTNAVNTVNCKATGSYQIRAVTIVVDATLHENFCTTIPAYSVTVGDAGYTTYVAANNVSFPVGATAYIATAVNPSTIHLEEVLAVPTGEAVVVKAAKGTYNLTVESSADCDDVSENLLLASTGITSDGSQWALAMIDDVVGFYKVQSDVTIPAGKAYLTIAAEVKEFLTFDFDTDAISDVRSKMDDVRGDIFNLAGQKMNRLQKGINIVNGKKVLVK